MKITLREVGGFAATVRMSAPPLVTLDTASLTPDKAHELRRLVSAARAGGSEGPPAKNSAKPDYMSYRITIEDDGQTLELRASSHEARPPIAELVEWLKASR